MLSQFYPTLMVTNYLLPSKKPVSFVINFYQSTALLHLLLLSYHLRNDPLFDYNLMFIPDHHVYSDLDKSKPKLNKSPDGIPSLDLRNCAVSLAPSYLPWFNRSRHLHLQRVAGHLPRKGLRLLPWWRQVPMSPWGDRTSPISTRQPMLSSVGSMSQRNILLKSLVKLEVVVETFFFKLGN